MKATFAVGSVWKTMIAVCACVLLFSGCASPSPDLSKSKQEPEPDVPPPVAKSGASFEETRDWIVATLSQYGGSQYGGTGFDVYTNVTISNSGVLAYTAEHYKTDYAGDYNSTSASIVKIPLGAVTIITLTSNDRRDVWVQTGQVADITHQTVPANNPSTDYSQPPGNVEVIDVERSPPPKVGESIPVSSEEMAGRLATALQHMVDICKDTYTAPAKTVQPF